jgi:heme-degrading monooxygenase HmoA
MAARSSSHPTAEEDTMYARVAQVRIQPRRIDEATRIYADNVVPALESQPGFRGALLLTQPESGRGISITLWESQADRTAGEVSGFYQTQLAHFAGMFTETPVRDAYEVAISTHGDRRGDHHA